MNLEQIENKEEKIEIAKKILDKVKDNQVIGVGSGSTVYLAVMELGKFLEEKNWNVKIIPASVEIEELCKNYKNIKIGNLLEDEIDWGFDGADEVDNNNNLLKGAGKALFREKINILSSKTTTYILADKSKFVDKLGEKHLVPIEVFPRALNYVSNELEKIGACEILYKGLTDNDNSMINAKFDDGIELDKTLENAIKLIPGVIESGLFIGLNVTVLR